MADEPRTRKKTVGIYTQTLCRIRNTILERPSDSAGENIAMVITFALTHATGRADMIQVRLLWGATRVLREQQRPHDEKYVSSLTAKDDVVRDDVQRDSSVPAHFTRRDFRDHRGAHPIIIRVRPRCVYFEKSCKVSFEKKKVKDTARGTCQRRHNHDERTRLIGTGAEPIITPFVDTYCVPRE